MKVHRKKKIKVISILSDHIFLLQILPSIFSDFSERVSHRQNRTQNNVIVLICNICICVELEILKSDW